jgi:dTDP-4-dehydrorhamnose reductase
METLQLPAMRQWRTRRVHEFRAQTLAAVDVALPLAARRAKDLGLAGLHCGSGANLKTGCLNTDEAVFGDAAGNESASGEVVRVNTHHLYLQHDATETFPIEDECFEWVYAEHFIEHISLAAGVAFLREWSTEIKPFLRAMETIADLLCGMRPGAVINAAAYTKVDGAESEPDLCRAVNALAVREIAKACERLDCPLVQVSTDYVLGRDATSRVPYTEDDLPGPVNVYGHAKLEGEQFAATVARHVIVRTCGLYVAPALDSRHRNFVDSILRLAGDYSVMVNDQHCTPTCAPHVARAIQFLLSTDAYGTYHVTERGETTWYELAVELLGAVAVNVDIKPIASSEYPSAARRPAYSVLSCAKYESLGGPTMPHWRDALREVLGTRASTFQRCSRPGAAAR